MSKHTAWFAASITLATGIALAQEPTPAQVDWIKSNALTYKFVGPNTGLTELEGLRDMIGDARIVALGEPTHGTAECFQTKNKIIEYLTKEMGFSIFSIEANMTEAQRLTPYVLTGSGDPYQLISGMYFWTWNTEEVHQMVEWMRVYNEDMIDRMKHWPRLQFTGFDMQFPMVAATDVLDFTKLHASQLVDQVQAGVTLAKEGENDTSGSSPAGFAVATATLPVKAALGKKVRYAGWIKSADVKNGFAGLWMRGDNGNNVAVFDNMSDRGATGTTEWTRYELSLDIPADTTNINFGVLMTGTGSAWFDDLAIEIDGQPYTDTTLDLAMESAESPKGFFLPQIETFSANMDEAAPHAGTRSLRFASKPASPHAGKAAKAFEAWKGITASLRANAEQLSAAAGKSEAAWAIQNATIVMQSMDMRANQATSTTNIRDKSMAENVRWHLEQNPGAKIILWAHNGHVARTPESMGHYLESMFPGQMVVVGFATGTGTYRAVSNKGKGLGSWDLESPPQGSFEYYCQATNLPQFILDIRKSKPGSAESGWLDGELNFRMIGALEMDKQFFPRPIRKEYDLMVWQAATTAAKPLIPPDYAQPQK